MSGSRSEKNRASELRRQYLSDRRRMMRGYGLLKKSGQIGAVRDLKEALVDARFLQIGNGSEFIFGTVAQSLEVSVRQYLLQTLGGRDFNQAILRSIGSGNTPIRYPLPSEWIRAARASGFMIDGLRSRLYFARFIAEYWLKGLRAILRLAGESIYGAFFRPPDSFKPEHSFFVGLDSGNLPRPDSAGESFDIVTWYANWSGRPRTIESLVHRVSGEMPTNLGALKVEYAQREFPRIRHRMTAVQFAAWAAAAVLLITWKCLLGSWWYALLMAECAQAKRIRFLDDQDLARDYVFHFSGNTYRPLWTYEAERKGSRILCYFYTTYEQPALPSGYVLQKFELGATTWPHYLVWDKEHAEFVQRECQASVKSEIVGTIWFRSSPLPMPALPGRCIAVFDQEQHRRSSHFGFSTLAEYFNANNGVNVWFLKSILKVLREFEITMVFKRKRNIGKVALRGYRSYCDGLANDRGVVMVDPDVSAIKVVRSCRAVISMPFTSTALYPLDYGIPSAYYDPAGWIQPADRAAHGVKILLGESELRSWVRRLVENRFDHAESTEPVALQ